MRVFIDFSILTIKKHRLLRNEENMQRNIKLFCRSFLLCALIGLIIDFIFNGFQIVIGNVVSDLIMDLLLAAITLYLCKEVEREISVDDAMEILKRHSLNIMDNGDIVIGVPNKYQQFFLGNLLYDKQRGIIIGSKIFVLEK